MQNHSNALAQLDSKVRSRLATLEKKLGRPLRILHIGNVANNGYINAKIMRSYGIEADAIAIDYYHVMGCPEWEEGVIAELKGTEADPDWGETDVGDFKRPRWFLQGPLVLVSKHLSAKAKGNKLSEKWTHYLIHTNLQARAAQSGFRKFAYNLALGTGRGLRKQSRNFLIALQRLIALSLIIAKKTFGLTAAVAQKLTDGDSAFQKNMRRLLKRMAYGTGAAQVAPGLVVASDAGGTISDYEPLHSPSSQVPLPTSDLGSAGDMIQVSAREDPDQPAIEPPRESDLTAYGVAANALAPAFEYYDIVQGYAIDGAYPLLGNKADSFTCYEHGTLRDLPFQPDMQGRICAHTYRNAPAVFITNTDCVAAADRLGVPKDKQFPIPHAFDSDRVIAFMEKHRETCKPENAPVTFIAPARHHWKHGAYVSWLKGNDVPIRAARLLADQGLDFKIIFVRWGQEVHESEALIEKLDVSDHFTWIDAVPKQRLWQYYMSCNGVLDQFVIPAIGGVSFETLAFGRPLFTRIDEPVFDEFFGKKPPLLNVHTPEMLADALGKVIRDPTYYDALGQAALDWSAQYHSAQRIMEIQLNGYDLILGN